MNTEDTRTTGILTESERVELQRAIAESDVAGCSLVDQDIDSLVDLFEAWVERREREPTVEDCLRELREMFPRDAIKVEFGTGASAIWCYVRRSGKLIANGETLSECMAQVRAWKQEQEK